VIGPTKYRAKHRYKLMNLLAKLKKCARFYFGNNMFANQKYEVESRYLPEKVTSLRVESSV